MNGRASLQIAAETDDLDTIAARSAGIWISLSLDDDALASIRRDGLDPAALRLSGLHPFEFERGPDGALEVIAHANDNEAAEALLDLFRVYFLRRLLTQRPVDAVPAELAPRAAPKACRAAFPGTIVKARAGSVRNRRAPFPPHPAAP